MGWRNEIIIKGGQRVQKVFCLPPLTRGLLSCILTIEKANKGDAMQEIKVFLPQAKGRNKTTARGFWLDGGRTYYDYVKPVSLPFVSAQAIPAEVKRLRVKHNQLAMFYITLDAEGDKASAFIQSEGGKVEALPRKASVFVLGRRAVRAYVKKFLQSFGGCTVYDIGRGYYEVEGWTK